MIRPEFHILEPMSPSTAEFQTAGLLRRLVALLYDLLLLIGLWVLMSALLLLVTGGRLADADRPIWLLLALRILLAVTTAGFFVGFWTHGGQTLGMRAWRLRLVTRDGGPVGYRQALRRLAAACLALAPAGLGLWWMLIDPQRRAWHDRLSGTRLIVVPKKH